MVDIQALACSFRRIKRVMIVLVSVHKNRKCHIAFLFKADALATHGNR